MESPGSPPFPNRVTHVLMAAVSSREEQHSGDLQKVPIRQMKCQDNLSDVCLAFHSIVVAIVLSIKYMRDVRLHFILLCKIFSWYPVHSC